MVKRAKATNKQRKRTKPATVKDYAKMVVAASSVVVQNRGYEFRTGNPEYVLFEFPFWVTFTRKFPKGHIVSRTQATNTYKINAVKLLDWLYDNGYSPHNVRMLLASTRSFEEIDKKLDRLFST